MRTSLRRKKNQNPSFDQQRFTMEELKSLLDTSVDVLDLVVENNSYGLKTKARIINSLKARKIIWIGKLVQIDKRNIENFIPGIARVGIKILEEALRKIGLQFGMAPEEINDWQPPQN